MGVIYKLRPEIKDYIVKIQAEKPDFGCRKLACLLADKFQLKVSKSSINSVIKSAGLSKPVGRRSRRRRIPPEAGSSGAILLKAVDCLIAGSGYISEIIKKQSGSQDPDLKTKIEYLLYSALFNQDEPALKALINRNLNPEDINPLLIDLQRIDGLIREIAGIIPGIFQEVRCVKLSLSDGKDLYLDGQFRTVWPGPDIPYAFSAPNYAVKSYIKKCFHADSPVVLFTAPGSDIPAEEFFCFLSGLNSGEKTITKLTCYNNKLEEIKAAAVENKPKRFFVFGLWPWQFSKYRKVNRIGEFKLFSQGTIKKDFYLAHVEIELSRPDVNKKIILNGCALKTGLGGKVNLIILSNFTGGQVIPEHLAELYLDRWPNLEEGFRDFSRKIEFFTYASSRQYSFSLQGLGLEKEPPVDIRQALGLYLEALDLYLRRNFFPDGYEKNNLSTMSDKLYRLKTRIKTNKGCQDIAFQLPPGYPFIKDLEYALRRLNEREIVSSDGNRLRFLI